MIDRVQQFYDFMKERELIRLRRLRGDAPPWTSDEVLRTYRFTNVKREHDRTTIAFKRLYDKHAPKSLRGVVLLNCFLYRFFGTAEMATHLGWSATWDRPRVERIVNERTSKRQVVFTNAYIVPNCGDAKPKYEVVCDILDQLRPIAQEAATHTSWQEMAEYLQNRIRGVGAFMAKEVLLDFVLATGWRPTDWDTWTPMGPGACRGAARIVNDGKIKPMSEKKALEVCRQLYESRSLLWPETMEVSPGDSVLSVNLDLTDIQFQLCEYDKWLRAKLGEGKPKNKFFPNQVK